jgi:hypothetical protein
MKKELFEQLVEPLGEFRRQRGGYSGEQAYEDIVFELNNPKKPCGDCDLVVKDRVIVIERKFDYKDQPYWRTKCVNCKKKWNNLRR